MMKASIFGCQFWAAALLLIAAFFQSAQHVSANEAISVTVRNDLSDPVTVFFEGDDKRVAQGDPIQPLGGIVTLKTFPGHRFSYDWNGERHWIDIEEGNEFIVLLGGKQEILVKCTTTADGFGSTGEPLNIRVIPWWSPRGAARFLDLVRDNYYDQCALNRVVPNFLTQFGLSADILKRRTWREKPIPDDPKRDDQRFIPGMLSYAGSGPNSRYGEVFIVMPDTPQQQLDHFGTNPWETPFGIVQGHLSDTPISRWKAYGDMPPWGSGPDVQRIHSTDGYEYLSREFPELDYIERCVVEEIGSEAEEEEL